MPTRAVSSFPTPVSFAGGNHGRRGQGKGRKEEQKGKDDGWGAGCGIRG